MIRTWRGGAILVGMLLCNSLGLGVRNVSRSTLAALHRTPEVGSTAAAQQRMLPVRLSHAQGGAPISCQPWRPVSSPSASQGLTITLSAVAAVSATNAWAVGSAGQELSDEEAVIEHWDGRQWQVIPGVRETGPSRLTAVAAKSAQDTWAVGSLLDSTGGDAPLVEHWDGARWRAAVLPTSTGDLYGVAAISSHDVWAVGATSGDYTGQPLTLHWDGTSWTSWPAPTLYTGENSTLYSVAAVSAHDVWAVGKNGSDETFDAVPLVEHWDGRTWHLVSNLDTAGFLDYTRFYSIAALSSNDVWVVGATGGARVADTAVVEHWNGTHWLIMASPNPGIYSNAFTQVAAVSAQDVWAIEHDPNDTASTFAVHWDGHHWIVLPGTGPRALGIVSEQDIWGVGTSIVHYRGPLCTADPVVGTVSLGSLPQEAINAIAAPVLPPASHLAIDTRTDRAFVASDPGTVRILDVGASSPAHALLRTVHLPTAGTAGSLLRALAIDEQSNRVFIADSLAGVVYMLDATDGMLLRTIRVGADPRIIVVAAGQNEVFVVNGNRDETNAATLGSGSVSVLNATTGAVVATLPTGENPEQATVDARAGRLYVADDGGIGMFDITQHDRPGHLLATIAITEVAGMAVDASTSHLFVAYYVADETKVAMLDAVHGTILTSALPGSVASSTFCCPTCDCLTVDTQTRRLFVATSPGDGGQLIVVDTATGRLVNTVTLPPEPRALAVDERWGRVFVTAVTQTYYQGGDAIGPGSVSVLDAKDGTLLTTIPVGVLPYALAVDAQASRAFVLTCCANVTILHTDPPPVVVFP